MIMDTLHSGNDDRARRRQSEENCFLSVVCLLFLEFFIILLYDSRI